MAALPFDEVWAVDFEFTAPAGDLPTPICVVGHEVHSGRRIRLFGDELNRGAPPYRTDGRALFVAYAAAAEIACHLALNWAVPVNILDLYAEFRTRTNGRNPVLGTNLRGALAWFGLPSINAELKQGMRALAIRGGPFTPSERADLLHYCEDDVEAVVALLPHLAPRNERDLAHARQRGHYAAAVARMERTGVPLDTRALRTLEHYWAPIQRFLVAEVDSAYGVYERGHFSIARFADYLAREQIQWPLTPSGRPALDDATFRDMAQLRPQILPLKELRATLGKLRLSGLEVGADGRNRTHLAPFRARTGRNQPSNTRSIFGPAVWIRGLIRPEPATALLYVDWAQQEFGIAAYLSNDAAMIRAYESGDPYSTFAVQAGLAPPGATKESHPREREVSKQCILAVQYGMGEVSLGTRLRMAPVRARELLRLHRQTYPAFWNWSNGAVDHAAMFGQLSTVFGWTLFIDGHPNDRSIRNFPMQGNGAEMLRLACCLATDNGVRVCAPVHDALLIEAPLDSLEQVISTTQWAMARASRCVLDGPELRFHVKTTHYPGRYIDERGESMWHTVWGIVAALETADRSDLCTDAQGCCTDAHPHDLFIDL